MMTPSSRLLVAVVVLVQNSFGVQAEPEVTSRGRLRGSRPTVSNETALPTGAVGCEQAVEQVREAFALQTQCRPGNFTPLSCRRQVDAGINWWRVDYFAKVDVQPCGVHGFALLHIYEGGPGLDFPAALDAVAPLNKTLPMPNETVQLSNGTAPTLNETVVTLNETELNSLGVALPDREWAPRDWCYGKTGHNPHNRKSACIDDVMWKMDHNGLDWHQAQCEVKKWYPSNCGCLEC
jgi:hypothetical protein